MRKHAPPAVAAKLSLERERGVCRTPRSRVPFSTPASISTSSELGLTQPGVLYPPKRKTLLWAGGEKGETRKFRLQRQVLPLLACSRLSREYVSLFNDGDRETGYSCRKRGAFSQAGSSLFRGGRAQGARKYYRELARNCDYVSTFPET